MAFASPVPVELSKIHQNSGVTVNSKFDLFKVPPTETTEANGQWIVAEPSHESPSSEITVAVPASDSHYTDLENSYFLIDVKLTRRNGDNLPGADNEHSRVYPVSFFAHALFERFTLKCNSTDVDHNSAYSQTAYTRALIDETTDTKTGRLTAEGWIEDGATGKNYADAEADSIALRKALFADGRVRSYMMSPFSSLDRQERVLPPGVTLKAVFNRSNAQSCLMSSANDENVVVKIVKFRWMVRRINASPSVTRALNSIVVEGNSYLFPIRKHRTRSHTVPQGVRSHRVVVDADGYVPNRLLVSLLTHTAFVGRFSLSPFKFSDYGLESIELTVDGVSVGQRLEFDFPGGRYATAYASNVASLGKLRSSKSNGISYDDFGDGKTVFVFNTATDLPNEDCHSYCHLRRKACTALILNFRAATAEPLSVQIADEREDLLEIDLENRVHTTTGVV